MCRRHNTRCTLSLQLPTTARTSLLLVQFIQFTHHLLYIWLDRLERRSRNLREQPHITEFRVTQLRFDHLQVRWVRHLRSVVPARSTHTLQLLKPTRLHRGRHCACNATPCCRSPLAKRSHFALRSAGGCSPPADLLQAHACRTRQLSQRHRRPVLLHTIHCPPQLRTFHLHRAFRLISANTVACIQLYRAVCSAASRVSKTCK